MLITVSGCTAMSSRPPDAKDSALGTVYYLPKAYIMLTVTVDEQGEQLMVEAAQPELVGDPEAAYSLTSAFNPFGGDDFVISVGKDGLLTSVNLKATGDLDESLVAAAKSAGKASKFLELEQRADNRKVVFQEYIDPAKLVNIEDELTNLNARIKSALVKVNAKNEEVKAAKEGLTIGVTRLINPSGGVTAPKDCDEGVCYRRLIPYAIKASVGGLQKEKMFQIPNGSPTYVAAVKRGVFSNWNTEITFENGMLTKYDHDHKSEAVEFFALPGELIDGFVSGVTEGFTSKSSVLEAEGKYLDSKVSYLEKKKEALEKIEKLNKSGAEPNKKLEAYIQQNFGDPLFSFVYGKDSFSTGPREDKTKVSPIPGVDKTPPPELKRESDRTREGSPGM